MLETKGPTMTVDENNDRLREMYGQKNNQKNSPQADANDVGAGGQDDLEALKAQVAAMTSPSETTEKSEPVRETKEEVLKGTTAETQEVVTPKLYAGKFKTPEELEQGYIHAESKIGSKTAQERLGEKLLKYSGQDISQLEAQLDAALVTGQAIAPSVSDNQQNPQADPRVDLAIRETQAIKQELLNQRLARETQELISKYPSAQKYVSTSQDLWRNVDTNLSMTQIYEARFKAADDAINERKIEDTKNSFSPETSAGKPAAKFSETDFDTVDVDVLAKVLPRKKY